MRVACILATHSVFPGALLDSVDRGSHAVSWHVFFHGPDQDLGTRIAEAVRSRKGTFRADGTNRGLARSWNEGIFESLRHEPDALLLLNDDLHFRPGGFDAFVAFAGNARVDPSVAYVQVRGEETGGSFAGAIKVQGFACCAITPRAIATIGYFDENFRPAYYEDMDHLARAKRAGLITAIDKRVLVEHDRSRTLRSDPRLKAEAARFLKLNREYYHRKWGGPPHNEVYGAPFDRPNLGLRISYETRSAPYGPALDRSD